MKTSERVHELFLNYACNAKCPFCYNPPITSELLRLELSFRQAAASLYRGAAHKARSLNLHGGEVTLRDDLPKILALARKLGFTRITLVTNGVRLASPAYVRLLVRAGVTNVRLSVHGANDAVHDGVVFIPGAFKKILAALKNLRALAVPVGLNFVLIRRNVRALPGFLKKFCLELGVDDVIVYFPHLSGMMEINAGTDGLRYEEAAPWVRRGAKALSSAGRLGALLLANFTPCVLPELADRMLDWSHHAEGSEMTHPEGFTENIDAMKESQRGPVAACRSCALERDCLGAETRYVARFGESSFNPLPKVPA